MAEVFQHPDSGAKPNEIRITSGAGTIHIAVKEGEILTVERANYLLDCVKAQLMEGSKP